MIKRSSAHAKRQTITPKVTPRRIALIYRDKGACDGCADPFRRLVKGLGLTPRFIHKKDITPKLLASAALFVQPGGDDTSDLLAAITPAQRQYMRDFVSQGGRYFGTCLGAYWAGRWVEDNGTPMVGLDMLPGIEIHSHSETPEDRVEAIQLANGSTRHVYFQDGPEFEINPNTAAKSLATYKSNGKVAGLITAYGKGRIAVLGFHPEATKEWYTECNLVDPDGLDGDIAQNVLHTLLSNK